MSIQKDASLGLKKETTYGTYVVPDKFLEFTEEKMEFKPEFLTGEGLRPGVRVARAGRRSIGKIAAGGSITVEAGTKGLGALLEAALGAVTNTVTAQPAVFQQVHTPLVDDWLPFYTIQKGVPLLGGSIQAMSFLGSQCESLEIKVSNSGIVTVSTDWVSRDAVTAPAYAPPSYPTDLELFTFLHGAIYTGAVTAPTSTALGTAATEVANITDFSVKWVNGLDKGGYNLGGKGRRTRRAALGSGEASGSLTVEYSDNVLRDAFIAQTPLTLVLTLEHPSVIGTSFHPTLQLVIPCLMLDGETPTASGGDVITTSPGFTILDPLVPGQAPFYIVYRTTDTAP